MMNESETPTPAAEGPNQEDPQTAAAEPKADGVEAASAVPNVKLPDSNEPISDHPDSNLTAGPGVPEAAAKPGRRAVRTGLANAGVVNTRAGKTRGRKSGVRTAAGVASGFGIALVAAAVIAAGTVFPGQPAAARIEPQSAKLPAGQTVANCAGPAQLLQGSAAGTDPQFSPASTSARTQVSAVASGNQQAVLPNSVLAPLSADPAAAPVATISRQPGTIPTPAPGAPPSPGKSGAIAGQLVTGPSVLRADPVAGQPTAAAAVQTYAATDGDLRGLASATCQSPSNDMWLLGASTEVGRTAILTLTNSSVTAATVNLDLFGDKGQIQSGGARGILVPAGSDRSVVLAGLAPGQKSLAVRARSNGGAISAVIQQSVLRGLVPGGVEFLTPVAAPDQAQVITGVQTLDPALAKELSGQSGYADAQTTLQVAVPGAADAIVQVQVFGQGGPASLPNGGVFTAKAGSVTELPLSGLAAGNYTVQISAPTAVTAAVRSVRGTKAGDPVDLAMAGASSKISDSQLLVLPAGVTSRLSFSSPTGMGQLSLTPIATDGAYQPAKSLDVTGGTTVLIDPAQLAGGPVSGFLVSASGDAVYGAQVLSQSEGNGLSVLALPRSVPGPQSLKIALGY